MIARRCRRCGFPRGVSDLLRWSEDGTTTERVWLDFRAAKAEADFLPEDFSHIERELGHTIEFSVMPDQEAVHAGPRASSGPRRMKIRQAP